MFKYILLLILVCQSAWAIPVQPQGDAVGSPILILTPQAQVRLESIPATYIHHLSPLARIAAPHEEAIIYVPASAGAPVVPLDAVNLARSSAAELQQPLFDGSAKQFGNISQQIEQIQATIQSGIGMYPPLGEAASAAAAAASAAASTGASLFPALFPPNRDQPAATTLEASAPALLSANARHLYVLPPGRIVDFGNGPFLVGPLSAIRARSLQQPEIPIVAVPLPAANKPEALPLLTADTLGTREELKEALPKAEKQPELIKLLETNAEKREELQETLEELLVKDDLKLAQNAKPSTNEAALAAAAPLAAPQLKSHDTVGLAPVKAIPVAGNELPLRKS